MNSPQWFSKLPAIGLGLCAAALCACSDADSAADSQHDANGAVTGASYGLASVVIDADGNRTTYVQPIASLEAGPFTNQTAIELPGNGVVMSDGRSLYVGLAEEPTWVRYALDEHGAIAETGRLSLLNAGASRIDFGNTLVDAQTAVSVLTDPPLAVVWNPETMEIRGEIDLASLAREDYELEVWTTIAHNGLVYVPARWSDWDGGRIYPGVSTTVLDPKAMTLVGTAQDDRCASGGRVVFDREGYAYVMGDGRNYAIQMFARASGGSAPDNCLLRIAPGASEFEPGYFHTIPSLTGGLQSITELETARQDSGIAFAKMFYPDQLPPGVEPVDFAFWDERAHKLWRIELADPPSAQEVQDIPFSTIGFEGSVLDGHLYSGESPDGSSTDVYEVDPDDNRASLRFSMDGYFNGLYRLAPAK